MDYELFLQYTTTVPLQETLNFFRLIFSFAFLLTIYCPSISENHKIYILIDISIKLMIKREMLWSWWYLNPKRWTRWWSRYAQHLTIGKKWNGFLWSLKKEDENMITLASKNLATTTAHADWLNLSLTTDFTTMITNTINADFSTLIIVIQTFLQFL